MNQQIKNAVTAGEIDAMIAVAAVRRYDTQRSYDDLITFVMGALSIRTALGYGIPGWVLDLVTDTEGMIANFRVIAEQAEIANKESDGGSA